MYNYQIFVNTNYDAFCLGRTKGKKNSDNFRDAKHPGWEYLNPKTLKWEKNALNCWEKSLKELVLFGKKNIFNFSFSFFDHNYD